MCLKKNFHDVDNRLNKKTILVVEDDKDIGPLLVEMLEEETSYSVIWVSDGIRALQVVGTVKPSLFITDYGLPSINGIELYDKLCEIDNMAEIPTIIMSAMLPEQEVKKRCLIGLKKPFELDELLNAVESLLTQ